LRSFSNRRDRWAFESGLTRVGRQHLFVAGRFHNRDLSLAIVQSHQKCAAEVFFLREETNTFAGALRELRQEEPKKLGASTTCPFETV
jgi:hypothetical protein